MAKIIIEGGNKLSGSVKVGGAKNAALPIMAGAILSEGPVVLSNIPHLNDVETMEKVLSALGITCKKLGPGTIELSSHSGISEEAPYELVKTMRASFFVMGPLLGRLKKARIPLPGGCAIGVRPVDIHLKGFEMLGARVSLDAGCAVATADKLVGAPIMLDFPSVGATENLMMAAVYAEGTTVINNAAREPEIVDLGNFLNSMGAKVSGAGTPSVTIEGVKSLTGTNYSIISDRIEAGTFLALGSLFEGPISVENCNPDSLHAVTAKLQEMGTDLKIEDSKIIVRGPTRIKPIEIKTLPFPGFPTDLQAQFTAALCLSEGASLITETVFENRFMHVSELIRMGAKLNIRDRTVVINGVDKLIGAPVMATDLRAGAAMVIAGLVAEGITEIGNVHHIDRGYDNFVDRLKGLGAKITRQEQDNHA
ncbi:MAG: UDP-N-acetylglucosamine 1-carboxyvinyltransferase [Candidatus Riflebacteria bacterium]|nr:UDP-N-acetylglucosamine 1-carboxyvinyltransferase [Candidatus Riflebacteria bacterium]